MDTEKKRSTGRGRKRVDLPYIGSQNPFEIITRLEADGQPWVLMSYPYSVRHLTEFSDICYEIIIWQTCEGDLSYGTMEMNRNQASEIIKQYGLTVRKRYPKHSATIYGKDDRLSELHIAYKNEIQRRRDEAVSLHSRADELTRAASKINPKLHPIKIAKLRKERDKLRKRERCLYASISSFIREYPKDNNIIIYQL